MMWWNSRAKDGTIDSYWDRDENDDDYGSGVKIIAIAPQEMNLKFYEHDDTGDGKCGL